MKEPNKEVIHKTEYIDKNLPTIYFNKEERKGLSDIKTQTLQVSGRTSEEALDTFKALKEELK